MFFFPRFQFAELVEPSQGSFDKPSGFAQATAVSRTTLGQDGLYPLF